MPLISDAKPLSEASRHMSMTQERSKLILIAAMAAGLSYLAADALPLPAPAAIAWKGAGVALLAIYAASQAHNAEGWLITGVMAFGALGDVMLEIAGLIPGALAFLVGHLIAIALYLRNRRAKLSLSQGLLAIVIIPATVVTAYLLPTDRPGAPGVALYALGLSVMAATAWISRFPRYLVGLGAMMFVASDLLIFAHSGPLAHASWIGLAIWGLYFAGQTAICWGVTTRLSQPAADAA